MTTDSQGIEDKDCLQNYYYSNNLSLICVENSGRQTTHENKSTFVETKKIQ